MEVVEDGSRWWSLFSGTVEPAPAPPPAPAVVVLEVAEELAPFPPAPSSFTSTGTEILLGDEAF